MSKTIDIRANQTNITGDLVELREASRLGYQMRQSKFPPPAPPSLCHRNSPFAAVIISLEIFENSAPRRKSAFPLSCLILDHRECPESIVGVVENGAEGWDRIVQDAGREDVVARLLVEQRSTEVQIVFNVGAGKVKVIVAIRESQSFVGTSVKSNILRSGDLQRCKLLWD